MMDRSKWKRLLRLAERVGARRVLDTRLERAEART